MKSKPKHTPGPWHVGDDEGPFVFAGDHYMVADCRLPKRYDDEMLKNAQLVSAAPELLQALRGLLGFLEEYPHEFGQDVSGYLDSASEAIAKAEGK